MKNEIKRYPVEFSFKGIVCPSLAELPCYFSLWPCSHQGRSLLWQIFFFFSLFVLGRGRTRVVWQSKQKKNKQKKRVQRLKEKKYIMERLFCSNRK